MDTQVGLELCTAGNAEKLTFKGPCTIVPGMIIIHSPVFPMLELSRSAEYASVRLQDNLDNIYSLLSQNISSPQLAYSITPFLHLTDEQQRFFLQRVEEIHAKEQQLSHANHPVQRKLLNTIVGLLKQETLLEHTLLFSAQLQETNQPI